MDDANKFLFFNVAPKLRLYGLIENEKVPGQAFRRVATTERGIAFLAGIERRQIQNKKKKTAASVVTPEAAQKPPPKRAKNLSKARPARNKA